MTASQLAAFWPLVAQIGTTLLPYVGIIVLAIAGWLGNELRLHVKSTRVLSFINAAVAWAEAQYPAANSGNQKKDAVTNLVQQFFPDQKGSKLSALIEESVAQLPQALPAFASAINGTPVEVKAPDIDLEALAGHVAPQLGPILAPLITKALGPIVGPAVLSALLTSVPQLPAPQQPPADPPPATANALPASNIPASSVTASGAVTSGVPVGG